MSFEQVGPRRAERPDGAVVEIIDRHHARLGTATGSWLVELGPEQSDDWFTVEVHAASLLRSGGQPRVVHNLVALDTIVEGLRAMRIRVTVVGSPPGVPDDVEDVEA